MMLDSNPSPKDIYDQFVLSLTYSRSHGYHLFQSRVSSEFKVKMFGDVLLHRENVIYTPHMAFYSCEAVQRILDTTMDNIRAFIEGKPANRVG